MSKYVSTHRDVCHADNVSGFRVCARLAYMNSIATQQDTNTIRTATTTQHNNQQQQNGVNTFVACVVTVAAAAAAQCNPIHATRHRRRDTILDKQMFPMAHVRALHKV